jgi:hypothetical protein
MAHVVERWLPQSFSDAANVFDDVHFDQLVEQRSDADPQALLEASCEFLTNIQKKLGRIGKLRDVKRAAILLPLRSTIRVRVWREAFWNRIGLDVTPPTLILMKVDRLFDRFDEEYSRVLDIPKRPSSVIGRYRSYRDLTGPSASIDFANGIYLTMEHPLQTDISEA